MSMAFDKVMQSVLHQSILEEYQEAQHASVWIKSIVFEAEDVARLGKKISLLPVDYKTILFCRYCFGFSAKYTEEAFALENATGQLRYVQNMLAFFMGIEDARIDDSSFLEATQMALEEYTTLDGSVPLVIPKYSARFRRKLRSIKVTQKLSDYILLAAKRVAVFLLVCTISFSTVLAVNAEAREQFFAWLVETFPRFSIFTAQFPESQTITVEDFERVGVQYIPDGFVLDERLLFNSGVIYQYVNGQGDRIAINISASSKKSLDTEGVVIKQMEFKGDTAFFWRKGNSSYLVWQQDGLYCNIIADCSMEETIKIAENLKS